MEYPIRFVRDYRSYSIFHTAEIDSTNSYFKREHPYFKDDSVLYSDYQSKGRGRFVRKWETEKGDLMFSLLKKNSLRYEILMPLCVMNVTRRLGISSFIKWPNDIYVGEKKMAGILIEDIYDGNRLLCQIIGVGINFSDKESLHAAGISSYTDITREDLLTDILCELSLLEKKPFEENLTAYSDSNLIYHRHILFHGNEYFVSGFTKDGHLLCQDEESHEIIIRSDEINIKDSIKHE